MQRHQVYIHSPWAWMEFGFLDSNDFFELCFFQAEMTARHTSLMNLKSNSFNLFWIFSTPHRVKSIHTHIHTDICVT